MYRLVYVSSATHLFGDDELRDLLEVSRRNNAQDDITGMLLYLDGNFIQVLEGEKETVLKTYQRVSRDSRHQGLITILQGEIEKREFADWSMGFRKLNSELDGELDGYNDFLTRKSDANEQRGAALRLLETFKSINR